jgi:hypothetical protein
LRGAYLAKIIVCSRYRWWVVIVIRLLWHRIEEGVEAVAGRLAAVIIILERLARGRGKRRGRPPLWMAQAAPVKRRGRPPGSKNRPKEERAAVA